MDFDRVLGSQAYRIKGITTEDDLSHIGKENVALLIETAREVASKAIAEGDLDQARATAAGIRRLSEVMTESQPSRPRLPRLRRECFKVGQPVYVFVGEMTNAGPPWRRGRVASVGKGYRGEWSSGAPNSGYYWRVEVEMDRPVKETLKTLAFSTSEPRVLFEADLRWLNRASESEGEFVRIYSENSERDWSPLWSQEGIKDEGSTPFTVPHAFELPREAPMTSKE